MTNLTVLWLRMSQDKHNIMIPPTTKPSFHKYMSQFLFRFSCGKFEENFSLEYDIWHWMGVIATVCFDLRRRFPLITFHVPNMGTNWHLPQMAWTLFRIPPNSLYGWHCLGQLFSSNLLHFIKLWRLFDSTPKVSANRRKLVSSK